MAQGGGHRRMRDPARADIEPGPQVGILPQGTPPTLFRQGAYRSLGHPPLVLLQSIQFKQDPAQSLP